MQQRNIQLQKTPPLKEGLIDAIVQVSGDKTEDVLTKIRLLEEQNVEVHKVYEYLQELAKPKLLIDKTPGYAKNIETLRNAESWFENPIYLYLYRHPLAMIGSFVKIQFHRVFGFRGRDPWKIAERIWYQFNHTAQEFLKEIPDERKMFVCYEDLVTRPREILPTICQLLGIEFEKAMCSPYDNNVNKLSGLHETSMMVGDPNITKHKTIDASMANSWKQYKKHWQALDDETKVFAQDLGYSSEGIKSKKETYCINLTKKDGFPELEILQRRGKLPPLVLLPPLFGNVALYSQLSQKLSKLMPIFALNGIEKFRSLPDLSLSDIATYYTERLIEFFAKGNIEAFHLGGFSFGGILSYEVLRQMQIRDQKVLSILIMDSACPDNFHQPFCQGEKNNNQVILDIALNGLFKQHSIACTEKQWGKLTQISNRDEVIQEIVNIGIENGLQGSREGYIDWFQNALTIAQWHYNALSEYKIRKLPDSESVICHYFRRKNWNNFYKIVVNSKKQNQYVAEINSRYEKQDPFATWSLFLPRFKSHITCAPQHYELLTNSKSIEQISTTMYDVYQTIKG